MMNIAHTGTPLRGSLSNTVQLRFSDEILTQIHHKASPSNFNIAFNANFATAFLENVPENLLYC